MELGNQEALERLQRDTKVKGPADPAWFLKLRHYWDPYSDECVVKQVTPPPITLPPVAAFCCSCWSQCRGHRR